VVAEGVESASVRDALKKSGCQEAQGYLLGIPLSSHETDEIFTRKLTELHIYHQANSEYLSLRIRFEYY
jgi:sensor c-di-GMP phosphodiesterase-like protein